MFPSGARAMPGSTTADPTAVVAARRSTPTLWHPRRLLDGVRPATRPIGQTWWQGDRVMLRIAQLAPPFVPVPPAKYGGTERVVSLLTEELVRRGHSVTLFASGDSTTSAELVPTVPRALWDQDMTNPAAALALALGTC